MLLDPDETTETAALNRKRRKRKHPHEADDYNYPNHLTRARKISTIALLNEKPSYCFKRGVTAIGSSQGGCESLRSRHRKKLRLLLRKLMLQHNWIEASGVLSVLIKGTVREKSIPRNRFKYSATLELLQKTKGDALRLREVQNVYDLWMKKLGSTKGWPTQDRFAVQWESILFYLSQGNTVDAHQAALCLMQEQGFESDSISNLLVGLTFYQLWYSTIPKEFQLEEFNRSNTPLQSHISQDETYVSSENSNGHDALNADGRGSLLEYDSNTSVGNEKDILKLYVDGNMEVSADVNVELQKEVSQGSFQATSSAERSGNEVSFSPNLPDGIPNASIFYTCGLPPWLLPLQLPQSTENLEKSLYLHRNMLNDYYKHALEYLRAALHLEPPAFEALLPLIQVLLLGDQVMEALSELESVSHKLDTILHLRLKAGLLEFFDRGNNVGLCTHFEEILKKDPTCSHSLAKLVNMHRFGIYSTEKLVEMIALHLDAMFGDSNTWKEMASCFFKLSHSETDEMSTCCIQEEGVPKSYENHLSQIPVIFTDARTKQTWQLRCRWWIKRHFCPKRLALDIASGDLQFLTYKAAVSSYIYGRESMYSVKATEYLTKENNRDMLSILRRHSENASGFCSILKKEIP